MKNSYVLVAVGCLLIADTALAQRAKRRPSADAAVLETLLEDQDTLNTLTTAHTRQIKELEERIADLEKQLDRMKGPVEEAAKVREEVAAIRAELDALKAREADLSQRFRTEDGRADQAWFQPRFELRIRPEVHDNKTDLRNDAGDDDLFYLQRLRIGAVLKPLKNVRAVAVIQDSRMWGEEASTTSNEENLDLHEGFVEVRDIVTEGLGFQVGRMELAYGAERQVGPLGWSNVGRAFDGARVFYERPRLFQVDAFATIVKDQGRKGGVNTDFFGLYARSDYFSFLDLEAYGFFLYNDLPSAVEKIGTIGARVVARPVTGLTVEGEAAVQFGRSRQAGQARLGTNDHIATAYFAQALYQVPVPTSPTVGLFFYSASGDADPTDGRNVAYRVLFPTAHGMLGYMDLFQWTGNLDAGPTIRVTPLPDVSLRLDYHLFFLSSNGGVLANTLGGTAVFPADQGRFLGQELDFVARWRALDPLTLEAGYSFFKPGTVTGKAVVTRDDGRTVALGRDLAHWFYFQGTLAF